MTDDFYRSFEDRMRGARELILERLRAYVPLLKGLAPHLPQPSAVDLGCGRGEWLETLALQGFHGRGVDLDAQMLKACHQRGLEAVQGDAVAFLKTLERSSIGVVSGFHVAEHLALKDLRELIDQARRVLVPGGLLILETPNPENLMVGSSSFYLDPTHVRPLPKDLLAFLAEYAGLKEVVAIRLNGDSTLFDRERVTLRDVLGGVSPDYAVIAQNPGNEAAAQAVAEVLSTMRGLSFEDLSARFEQRIEKHMDDSEIRAQNAEIRAQQAEERIQLAENRTALAETRAQQAESRAQQAEWRTAQIELDLKRSDAVARASEDRARRAEEAWFEMGHSFSMRITRPLRWFRNLWRDHTGSVR